MRLDHPEYSASLEWLCACQCAAVLRLHVAPGDLGDPYVWSCVVKRDGDNAVLKAALKAPPNAQACRALSRAVRQAGFLGRVHFRHESRLGGAGVRCVSKPV